MQKTVKNTISIEGIGLHSGVTVHMSIHPASPDHGVTFKRVDITDGRDNVILARWDNVVDARLCTVIGNEAGVTVGTIEHVMAALRGCGVDNAIIEVDAPELPIMDGSSKEFVEKIEEVGTSVQSKPRRAIRILKEITYQEGDKTVRLSPSAIPVYAGTIQFDNQTIGTQSYEMKLVNGNFKHDMADCRTFCMLQDVEMMQANGLALGGSLDNAIVVDETGVMNEEGTRCQDEFIRHKLLDAVGDISLCGGLFIGRYESLKGGHEMNNKALRALFADDSAWEIVDMFVEVDEADSFVYEEKSRVSAVSVA